jgi:hypothetical protein
VSKRFGIVLPCACPKGPIGPGRHVQRELSSCIWLVNLRCGLRTNAAVIMVTIGSENTMSLTQQVSV